MTKNSFPKKLFVSALTGVLLASSVTACNNKAESSQTEPQELVIDVEVIKPTIRDIEIAGDFMGKVEADSQVSIIPKIAGDVTATFFEVGDYVNEGDLLFTVDDSGIQIQLAQARASYDSVSASVNTAAANVELNKYNMLYTQAQIEQTLGTAETDRMRLENAVASAKYALQGADRSSGLALEQFGMARDNYDEFEETMDDLKGNADNLDKYSKNLARLREVYSEIARLGYDEAVAALEERGIEVPDNIKEQGSAQAVANYFIYASTGGAANSEYELGVMVTTASNQASNLRSQRSSMEGTKDTLRLSQIQAAIGVETSKNNVLSADDGKRLAEKMLQDYDTFTMATIIAGTNSQLAGANVQAISAEAGLNQAKAGVRQAKAGVDAAELQLQYTQVKTPVSGTVTAKNVTVNNMASQAMPAYVISSDGDQNVSFNVAETVMSIINIGDPVTIERNGSTYEGVITENSGIPSQETGLFKIKAKLNQKTDTLISGTSVKISLITQKALGAMVVPVDCVYYENRTPYVYVDQNGSAVKTIVDTGITDNEYIEITGGLSADAKIITTWNSQLADGVKVNSTQKGGDVSDSQKPGGVGGYFLNN